MESQQKAFGAWLREHRKDQRMTVESLAAKAQISKQYLSVLERASPHALTGKPVTPKVEIVDRIAAALGLDKDEARQAAGYAPIHQLPARAETVADFLKGLEALGVDHVEALGGSGSYTEEHLARLKEDLAIVVRLNLIQATRPPERHYDVDFTTDDMEQQQQRPDNVRDLPPKRTRRA